MAKGVKQKNTNGAGTFAVRPFTAIKGIAVENKAADPKRVVPSHTREKALSREEDDLLFLTEMAGVARIHSRTTARQNSGGKSVPAKPHLAPEPEENRFFLEALKEMKLDVRFADEIADDPPSAPRKTNRMRQVRRGTLRLNLEIDLHGLTRDEALDALASFIAAACRRGQQAVLVIAGKGNHSAGEPVLQGAVAGWLRAEGKEWVTEFVAAPPNLGGDGAYVVFLKAVNSEG